VTSSFGQPGTSFTATGLTPSTTYQVQVRATNAAGTSSYSAPVQFTTSAAALPTGAVTGTLVSTDSTVATSPDARLGVNVNYWMDNQAIRTGTPRTLAAALADLKPKIIRYPGGEKADGTTFFQTANQGASGGAGPNPRLNRIGTGGDAWPSSDAGYWNPPGDVNGTWAASRPPYALQTFLTDCATVGAQPLIVLALDGIYLSPPAGGVSPTKAQMITNAVEMVRWLNVTNNYGVKYFEIGNETWQVAYLGGLGSTFANGAQYGTDFADVAAAMKAVDPTIQVGMNGNVVTFFDGFFSTAAAAVDFVSVHPYDTAGMSYATYQSSTITATQIGNARTSLDKLAAQHRDRIWITVTESSHFATSDTDPNGINNLGSAIITAHLLGLQLNDPRVRHVIFWNTRWITNGNATKLAYDAFAPDNSLLPVGQALRFLGKLSGRMVQATTGVSGLVVYASQVVAEGRSSVLIINRSAASQSGTVGMAGAVAATAQRLSGTGATDTAPTLTNLGAITVTGGVTASITAPANSLTLVDFTY
jgi:alpha-N-arabinofuranosidase